MPSCSQIVDNRQLQVDWWKGLQKQKILARNKGTMPLFQKSEKLWLGLKNKHKRCGGGGGGGGKLDSLA